jgi:energy-coupling factor transport system ATP-binding protein
LIRIEKLIFFYADDRKPALNGIDLEIEDGEFVLITGSSGSGKSSLARCLNGLIPHFYGGRLGGRVEVSGMDVSTHAPNKMATCVGMVFQDPENQLVTADVEREIAFGMENLSLPRHEMAKRLEEVLDTVGIAALRKRQLHELSGGEKQKVAIASVLVLKPEILVLDEPTSELDPQGAEDVLSTVQRLNDELGITVILVEHRLERVVHLADRLIVMEQGQIIADGTPERVMEKQYVSICRAGVGIPPLIRLVHEFKERGMEIKGVPLTVKEGRQLLKGIFEDSTYSLPPAADRPESASPVIETENLWYAYNPPYAALKGVDLSIGRGEFVAIMGRNAAGKSTLVKHFIGLLRPSRGKVRVNGLDTMQTSVASLARHVGYVFQNPNDHLFAETVEEEVATALKGLGFSDVEGRVREWLNRFDLLSYAKQYPRFLSGGEKQRVALATVLSVQPQVLILDEPTRGMDQKLKDYLMRLLCDYQSKGNTVIIVTHDVEMVAEYAQRVILLGEGKVIVDGDKRQVLSQALLFSPQINRVFQGFARLGVPQDILTTGEVLQLLQH